MPPQPLRLEGHMKRDRRWHEARVMRVAMFALLIGCTPAAQAITPAHPAHPEAETGRLAGPPAALRPGVVEVTPPAPVPRDEHAGHEMPASTPAPLPAETQPTTPSTPVPKKPPAKTPAKKVPAKPPAKDPHEGHTPAQPSKPADDPHKGHHGHSS